MSKRSEAFKNSIKTKNSILSSSNDKPDVLDNNIENKICNLIGMSPNELKSFLENTGNDDFNSYVLLKKSKYKKVLDKSYHDGYELYQDMQKKEIDNSFKRGVEYGRQQRENELRVKYDFVKKTKNINKKQDCFSTEINPRLKHNNLKPLNEIFDDVFKNFDNVFEKIFNSERLK